MPKRHSQRPVGVLFTQQERQAEVDSKTTALDLLDLTLDWEMFRPVLDQNLDFKQPEPGQLSKGGRPSFDAVLMFKVLILQKFHALADDQWEYWINDRHSFQRFRARLGREGIEALFAAFDSFLREQGLLLQPAKIIYASFVDVPRQHNTCSENQQLKEGQIP